MRNVKEKPALYDMSIEFLVKLVDHPRGTSDMCDGCTSILTKRRR